MRLACLMYHRASNTNLLLKKGEPLIQILSGAQNLGHRCGFWLASILEALSRTLGLGYKLLGGNEIVNSLSVIYFGME